MGEVDFVHYTNVLCSGAQSRRTKRRARREDGGTQEGVVLSSHPPPLSLYGGSGSFRFDFLFHGVPSVGPDVFTETGGVSGAPRPACRRIPESVGVLSPTE